MGPSRNVHTVQSTVHADHCGSSHCGCGLRDSIRPEVFLDPRGDDRSLLLPLTLQCWDLEKTALGRKAYRVQAIGERIRLTNFDLSGSPKRKHNCPTALERCEGCRLEEVGAAVTPCNSRPIHLSHQTPWTAACPSPMHVIALNSPIRNLARAANKCFPSQIGELAEPQSHQSLMFISTLRGLS